MMIQRLGMRISSRFPLPILCAFIFVFALIVIWFQRLSSTTAIIHENSDENVRSFNFKDADEIFRQCIGTDITLDNLHEILNKWSNTRTVNCRSAYDQFSHLFYFRKSDTEVVLSETFSQTVSKWFNGNKDLLEKTKHQFILVMMNKFTKDATLINPLRNKRPGFAGGPDVDKYVNQLVDKSKESCDFCNYRRQSGMDSFGYLESKHSVTIANTFKIERFHGLALWKHHSPLEFNEDQFLDLMELSQKWFRKCFEVDKSFTLPSLLWDILPKASASQIHPHAHMFVSKDFYFSGWEKIFRAANEYRTTESRSYFSDLVKIHTILQLNITYGDAVAYVSITPSVSNEVVILSKRPGNDLFKLFYRIMKAFVKLKLYAITAGAVFPPLEPTDSRRDVPCIIRIVNRGAVDKMRSDISSMELFGSGNINVDFWDFRKKLLENLEK
ncbi:uncharacterized protein LOC114540216 [Dendronephthya gigantea]|uniref:uncharacterized protein LOC114540216 n=1 Tax=Dendronephthya gigantea TaxID=151771 RepID=UPI001069E9EA|nr:uncharacterized protein LOC114540216 [Dendronephthya gigantea]